MGREAVNLFSRGGICPPPRATDTATRSVCEKEQALVVGRLNNAIRYIKLYPVDNAIHFAITYPPDSDLSAYREFKLLLQRPVEKRNLFPCKISPIARCVNRLRRYDIFTSA